MDELTAIPAQIVKGTTVKLRRSFSDYPASGGWTYKIFLVGTVLLNKPGVAAGADFTFTLTADDTGTLTAGAYEYFEQLTKAAEIYEGGRGTLEVLPDLATQLAGDVRSHARKVLEAIEAVIENRATKDQMAYQIAGRSLSLTPLADLLLLRDRYAAEVMDEETAAQLGDRRIRLRFEAAS